MASQEPIFRTIDVGTGQQITLAETLSPEVRQFMDPPLPSHSTELTMKPGTFGQAATITVDLVADTMVVQKVVFTYNDKNPSYETLLQDYTEMLGPPHLTGTLSDAKQSASWSDASTSFTLWERGNNTGSQLQDLLA
ncbi:hypothetical protein [Longimicrobium sp.]|uniref:hypothetical protein n=1 Tax=Longimicrobium sp. TaxID=2029185 RepID=UPI002E34F8E4|nr:hypothetical protein [Longimicrobium sp.]HEX6038125.1 hypothetical protein [Longimicrobium sp.]